jgi:hypothetical protein
MQCVAATAPHALAPTLLAAIPALRVLLQAAAPAVRMLAAQALAEIVAIPVCMHLVSPAPLVYNPSRPSIVSLVSARSLDCFSPLISTVIFSDQF